MTSIILASASPRRRELFGLLGLPFVVRSVDVDETPRSGESPQMLVARLSGTKAAVARSDLVQSDEVPDGVLMVAADTVVVLGEEILGKPEDAAHAAQMLRRLRGRSHQVYSAVAVVEAASGRATIRLSTTDVWMRDFADAEMEAYINSGDPLDKAGAYAIQHSGFRPVDRIEGCYTGVVGLPLECLVKGLADFEVVPPVDVPAICRKWTGHDCCMEDGPSSIPA
ncbi:MAG: septum formation protein Maf [Ardenticatenia bacterium]|nr:septum formation protein Maf [Ardenticatenia bacterium]